MAPTPTPINLSDSNPAAATGKRNANFQASAAYPFVINANGQDVTVQIRDVSAEVPNLGGVDARTTTSETIGAADQGKMVTIGSVSPCAVTLDSTVPNTFMCVVVVEGAGGATLTPSSGTIDGAANLVLGQFQGIVLYFDGVNWKSDRGLSSAAAGIGGVNVQTANYNVVAGDSGKDIVLNSAGAHTFTLLNPPPSTTWAAFFQNIGAGTLTIGRNSLTIDGAASDLTLLTGQGVVIFTDGSNYFTERGLSSGAFTNGQLGITTDGAGNVPLTGVKGYLQVPYDCTIVSWTLLANLVGSCQFDIKKSTYAGFPSGSSIVASAPPAISSAQNATSSSLGTWTTAITKGDVLEFDLTSITVITRITLTLQVTRSD